MGGSKAPHPPVVHRLRRSYPPPHRLSSPPVIRQYANFSRLSGLRRGRHMARQNDAIGGLVH
ncbi:hypothetical protein [Azospirillum sp. TSA6c]|uniref:hypothetical protein n=1 Tax=unclassified Azospirillum TaxID=2630922 RepID=UPI0011B3F982|nr:hypothetical protein [Azospirillum sp. TSA6c]